MFLFYAWQKGVRGLPESDIWNTAYFLADWQNFFDVFNSIPLLLAAAWVAKRFRRADLEAFFLSASVHCVFDLFLHHDDAHRHFFPFLDFRFASPVSYWDPRHGGALGAGFELAAVGVASVWLWRSRENRWLRVGLVVTALLYVAGYASLAIFGFPEGAP